MRSDLLLLVGLLAVAACAPRGSARMLRFLERPLGRIARNRRWAIVLVGCIAVGASAALSLGGIPTPGIHDEFSNLLAADTFAHGRLTNPPHPLWVHFESMHILQQPTYASKYPPGQGLALALGQVLTGYPIAGVWLSSGLACAALCWMLMAWLPTRWAVLGGLLWAVNPTMLFWSQGYWGGAVPVCGGALVLGAAGRLATQPRKADGFVLALGMAILANSRPFEGLVLCLLALTAWAVVWFSRSPRASAARLTPPKGAAKRPAIVCRCLALPLATIMVPTIAMMGYYNWRVTGSPVRMPYAVHEATYAVTPPFSWQKPGPEPAYRHDVLRTFYTDWASSFYEGRHSWRGLLDSAAEKLTTLYEGYFKLPIFLLSIGGIPWVLKDRRMRWVFGMLCAFVAVLLSETWMQWHYAGPGLGLLLILIMQGLRQVRIWRWRDRPVGLFLVRTVIAISLLTVALSCRTLYRANHSGWKVERARLLEQLTRRGGKHLVVVRYQPGHDVHSEWAYNGADIESAAVIWAREMTPPQNLALIEYFSDRQVWLLEADAAEPQVAPFR